jgi:hypothetical protein
VKVALGSDRQMLAGGQITTKHDNPTISTCPGISIDSSAKSENNCEPMIQFQGNRCKKFTPLIT